MIQREAWHREVVSNERELEALRQRVLHQEEAAVIPYLNLKFRLGLPLYPLSELRWLLDTKVRPLRDAVEKGDFDTYSSLLFRRKDLEWRGEPLWQILSSVERSTRVAEEVLTEQAGPWGTPWEERGDLILIVFQEIMDFSADQNELIQALSQGLKRALAERDASPEAVEYREQYVEDMEWIQEQWKELKEIEAGMKALGSLSFLSLEDEDMEEEARNELEYMGELHGQIENGLEYLKEVLGNWERDLLVQGYLPYTPTEDGHFLSQMGDLGSNWSEFEAMVRSHRGTIREV